EALTGLYFFRFRWFSPTLGRWLDDDPLGFAAGDSNLYRYAGNNPPNGVDPNGLQEPPNVQAGIMNGQCEALKRRVSDLEKQVADLVGSMDAGNKAVADLGKAIGSLNRRLNAEIGLLSKYQQQLVDIKKEIQRLSDFPNKDVPPAEALLDLQ